MWHLSIDTRSALPIYEQIVDQVRQGLSSGVLVAGDRLPSIRDLAVELKVNRNTVAHAYRELKRLGWIQTSGPLGAFVTAEAGTVHPSNRELWLRKRVDAFVQELEHLGCDRADILSMLATRAGEQGPAGDRGDNGRQRHD